jgi:hypothetical protein
MFNYKAHLRNNNNNSILWYLSTFAKYSIIIIIIITTPYSSIIITTPYSSIIITTPYSSVIETQELVEASIHPSIHLSIKTDLVNGDKYPSTKSHSRSYSPNRTVAVGLTDENRPKPMNSASKWYSLSLISSLSSLLSCSSINIIYDHHTNIIIIIIIIISI